MHASASKLCSSLDGSTVRTIHALTSANADRSHTPHAFRRDYRPKQATTDIHRLAHGCLVAVAPAKSTVPGRRSVRRTLSVAWARQRVQDRHDRRSEFSQLVGVERSERRPDVPRLRAEHGAGLHDGPVLGRQS